MTAVIPTFVSDPNGYLLNPYDFYYHYDHCNKIKKKTLNPVSEIWPRKIHLAHQTSSSQILFALGRS